MAVTAIGQLFAALTGKGTVIKATNAYKDYAASLKKTGAAAKDATLGIDELNVIQKKSGSGASGGLNPGDMFEEVPIENQYKDLAGKTVSKGGYNISYNENGYAPSAIKTGSKTGKAAAPSADTVESMELGTRKRKLMIFSTMPTAAASVRPRWFAMMVMSMKDT